MKNRFLKKAAAFLLAGAILCGLAGCDRSTVPESSEVSYSETGFDIERVRKNIVIKGQTIEIPVKLKDIPKGWSYKLYDEKDVYLKDNQFLATMFYNGEEMYTATLEQYNKNKPKQSIIYNLTIYDKDCSIDGLTPQLTTKQDVVDKYGEPLPEVSSDRYYYYGVVNGTNSLAGRSNDHSIGVRFTEDDIIKSISITYADLTKQN